MVPLSRSCTMLKAGTKTPAMSRAKSTSSGVMRLDMGSSGSPVEMVSTSTGGVDSSTVRTASSVVTARMSRLEASDSPPTKKRSSGCSPARTCASKPAGSTRPASRSLSLTSCVSAASSSTVRISTPSTAAISTATCEPPSSTMPSRGAGAKSEPKTIWTTNVPTSGKTMAHSRIGERGPRRRSFFRTCQAMRRFIAPLPSFAG